MFRRVLVVLASCFFALPASAESELPKSDVETRGQSDLSVTFIAPVFGQLVTFKRPNVFVSKYERTKSDFYIYESVLKEESVDQWSQMTTVTGFKGLASNANVTPAKFLNNLASRFHRDCPESYAGSGMGETPLEGYETIAAVLSCGVSKSNDQSHSESALIVVIKGASDYYTLQWAERAAASPKALPFDKAKWTSRLQSLLPIRLCDIKPGEVSPYPSCISPKKANPDRGI